MIAWMLSKYGTHAGRYDRHQPTKTPNEHMYTHRRSRSAHIVQNPVLAHIVIDRPMRHYRPGASSEKITTHDHDHHPPLCPSKWMRYSCTPSVRRRARTTSASEGVYSFCAMRSRSSRKLGRMETWVSKGHEARWGTNTEKNEAQIRCNPIKQWAWWKQIACTSARADRCKQQQQQRPFLHPHFSCPGSAKRANYSLPATAVFVCRP